MSRLTSISPWTDGEFPAASARLSASIPGRSSRKNRSTSGRLGIVGIERSIGPFGRILLRLQGRQQPVSVPDRPAQVHEFDLIVRGTVVRSSGRVPRGRPRRAWGRCVRCSAAAPRLRRRDRRSTGNTSPDCDPRSRRPRNPRPVTRTPMPRTTRAPRWPMPAPARTIRGRARSRVRGPARDDRDSSPRRKPPGSS